MNNYIGPINAEWVDPAVELPEKNGLYFLKVEGGYPLEREWIDDRWYPEPVFCKIVAWLRIGGPSDAIPRESVQAAVDEMKKVAILHEKFKDVEYFKGHTDGMNDSLAAIRNHTGVTPSEAPDIRPVEFRRGVILPRKFDDDEVTP